MGRVLHAHAGEVLVCRCRTRVSREPGCMTGSTHYVSMRRNA
jgi:hypothetical protein